MVRWMGKELAPSGTRTGRIEKKINPKSIGAIPDLAFAKRSDVSSFPPETASAGSERNPGRRG